MEDSLEMEKTREQKAIVIGRLGDLGIGNPDGIPSIYVKATDSELEAIAERDHEALVEPTDTSCTSCIDGRRCKCNADGSAAKIRLHRVGGSASNFGVALNSDASVIDTINPDTPLGEQIEAVDDIVGYRSAHLGGCGGAGGEITDDRAIHEKPAILNATKAFMEIPEVKEYFGVGYDDALGERVRSNAAKTAAFLEAKGWSGEKYVEGVRKQQPENTEDLEVDHEDEKFHGHKESKITITIGDKTSVQDDEFVWDLKATKEAAEKLAGQRGQEGYQQALIAEVAKHFATSDRLASDKTPVILQIT